MARCVKEIEKVTWWKEAEKETHEVRWQERPFREAIFKLRSECGGASHSNIWDEYCKHSNQQVQRPWGSDEGDMLEECLCSPGNLIISFQSPSHLWSQLHNSKRRSIRLCLYTFHTCTVHTELHVSAYTHAFLTGLWTPEVSSGRIRIASSSLAQSWHIESTQLHTSK